MGADLKGHAVWELQEVEVMAQKNSESDLSYVNVDMVIFHGYFKFAEESLGHRFA